jgi:gliding motility-associated-like protein
LHTSIQGCKDSATQTVTVWPRPVANFTIDAPNCETQPTTLRDASVANFSALKQWNWTFGDGTTDTRNSQLPFTHAYAATGNFNAQLQVTTDSGCTSIPVTKTIKINPLPLVDFTLPVVCMPAGTAAFIDKSSIADGSQAQFNYNWNFGITGASSTVKNPVYNYPAVGTYPVKLVVTSKDGCKDSTTKILTDVNPQPLSNFDVNPIAVCLGAAITFSDRSNPLSHTITGWFWNFGDGQTASAQQATHTYKQAGSFDAKLFYTTSKGCNSDTMSKPVTVHPYPVVNAGPDLVVLEGGQTTINATATGSSSFVYAWTPVTYLSNPLILKPITKPSTDISYLLTVTGTGGCVSSDDVFVKVLLAPEIPTAFSPNGDGINDVWNIKYISSYPGAVIQVFDRYGKQVFISTGYSTPWDGKINGKNVPLGVYYYVIDPKNGRKPTNGSVTIVY